MTEETRPIFAGARPALPSEVEAGAVAAVLGIPTSAGSAKSGSENGPALIRRASSHMAWSAGRSAVLDLTGADGPTPLSGVWDIGNCELGISLAELSARAAEILAALPAGTVLAGIGGDHSITYPLIEALLLSRPGTDLTVVQFDHHLDVQVWELEQPNTLFNTNVMSHVARLVGAENVYQAGVFPYVPVEEDDASAVCELLGRFGGQAALFSRTLHDEDLFVRWLPSGRDVYLTIDVDVLDVGEMSSTGYPAEHGLSLRELQRMVELVLQRNRVVGLDLVEFATTKISHRTIFDAGRAANLLQFILTTLADQRRPGRQQ
ncbi:arginase family protein [Kribbella sp. NPDC051620]|uniref:arginase family protein n=1 Tax=Kribbella sp. NPDC051620 TaxID=3364120 RepID=UPI0037AE11D5